MMWKAKDKSMFYLYKKSKQETQTIGMIVVLKNTLIWHYFPILKLSLQVFSSPPAAWAAPSTTGPATWVCERRGNPTQNFNFKN